jgi:acyl-CoA thioesterase FadM
MLNLTLRMMNQMLMGLIFPNKVKTVKGAIKGVQTTFRLWPVDLDLFLHMNNASYIRVAELHRWRMLTESGLLNQMVKDKTAFLAVDQSVTYSKPILPFQKYVVTTTVKSSDDDKWMYYQHSFDQPGEDEKTRKHYALVTLKAVMKAPSGKTVKPSELYTKNNYFKELVEK